MKNNMQSTEAARQYDAAYAAHYKGRDLPSALGLYRDLMASHPAALEAGYARVQILNIVNTVVPREELLTAQTELALSHMG